MAFVGSTPRGSQWLDTRQHPDWVPEVQRLKTTEALRQFFRQKMATELSDKNRWITDFSNDGAYLLSRASMTSCEPTSRA